jgi:hypothetical protein
MIDYAAAIAYMRPGEEWTLDGNEYAGLTWLSDTTKPTDAQLIAAWPKAQEAQQAAAATGAKNAADAIAHAKSLGFTDAMISAMYPALITVAP